MMSGYAFWGSTAGKWFPQEDPFKSKVAMFNSNPREPQPDPFQTEDPFKSDPFIGDALSPNVSFLHS